MAKRKHATALFEVYRQGGSSNGSGKSGWSIPLPRWMRSGEDGGEAGDASLSDLVDRRPEPENDPTERFTPVVMTEHEPAQSSRAGLRVSVDSSDQTISVMLSYGSAAVVCFAMMVVVGLAYVMGKHSGRGPLPLLADRTTDEVRQDKPNAEVLDVGPGSAAHVITPAVKASQNAKPSPTVQTWNDPRPPATLVTNDDDKPRQLGLNYVIIQNYPDLKDANAAVELLGKHGIKATVEDPPAGFNNPNVQMHAVIGKTGFDKVHNSPEYDRYCATVTKIGEEFAKGSKYRRFAPTPFKWRDAKKN